MSAAEKFLKGGFCSVSSAPACSIFIEETLSAGKPNLPIYPTVSVLGLQPAFGCLPLPALRTHFVPQNKIPHIHHSSALFAKGQNSPQHQKTFRLRRKDFCPSGSCCLMNIRPTHPAVAVGRLQSFGFPHRPLCACFPL